jgi:hypothetical protein
MRRSQQPRRQAEVASGVVNVVTVETVEDVAVVVVEDAVVETVIPRSGFL